MNLESVYKFDMSNEIKSLIKHDDIVYLTEIGIPTQILSNRFNYYQNPIINGDNLILGDNESVPEWKLQINIIDSSIFYAGKGLHTDFVYAFYNSSIRQLNTSLFVYNFVLRKMMIEKLFGEYNKNYERYADFLYGLLKDIDENAISQEKQGVWYYLIDEMRLGVI